MKQAMCHSRARPLAAVMRAFFVVSALFACGPKEQPAPPLPAVPVAPTAQPAAPPSEVESPNPAKESGEGGESAPTVGQHEPGTATSRATGDSAAPATPDSKTDESKTHTAVGAKSRKPSHSPDADAERALLEALQNESPEERQRLNSMLSGETLGKGTPLGVKPRK